MDCGWKIKMGLQESVNLTPESETHPWWPHAMTDTNPDPEIIIIIMIWWRRKLWWWPSVWLTLLKWSDDIIHMYSLLVSWYDLQNHNFYKVYLHYIKSNTVTIENIFLLLVGMSNLTEFLDSFFIYFYMCGMHASVWNE